MKPVIPFFAFCLLFAACPGPPEPDPPPKPPEEQPDAPDEEKDSGVDAPPPATTDAGAEEPPTIDAGTGENPPVTDAGTGETSPTDAGSTEDAGVPVILDCNGVENGGAIEDCATVCGGSAYTDQCGTCVEGTTGLLACEQDCNAEWGGSAFIDECDLCVGGATGLTACIPEAADAGVDAGSGGPDETTDAGSDSPGETTDAGSDGPGETTDAGSDGPGETTDAGSDTPGETTDAGSGTPGETTDAGSGTPGETTDAGSGTPEETTDAGTPISCGESAGTVFISEYIEGTSYNKALELYNAGDEDVDLSLYEVILGVNGQDFAAAHNGQRINSDDGLTGTLASGAVFVICHSSASNEISNVCDLATGNLSFNGNDAVGLFACEGLVDAVGKEGVDPSDNGEYGWDVGAIGSTYNQTLIRAPCIAAGEGDWNAQLYDEWIVLGVDTFSHLGFHDTDCVEPTDAGSGTPGETTDAGSGTTGETTDAGSGTTGETTDAGSGTPGETTDAGSGTPGETTDAGSGTPGETTDAGSDTPGETTDAGSGESPVSCIVTDDGMTQCTYYDATSGLTWQRCPGGQSGPDCDTFSAEADGGALDWHDAFNYCALLSWGGYEEGWRLPNIDELRSLIRGCPQTETNGSCTISHACSHPYDSEGCSESSCDYCDLATESNSAPWCYLPDELTMSEPTDHCWGVKFWSSSQISVDHAYTVGYSSGSIWSTQHLFDNHDMRARCVRFPDTIPVTDAGVDAGSEGPGEETTDAGHPEDGGVQMALDCFGVENGDAIEDCNGDCAGIAYTDQCDSCVEGETGTPPCEEDCAGTWGGTAFTDYCDLCVSTAQEACITECGDGVITLDETCDDGDLDPDNGCTDNCIEGFGFDCVTSNTGPSVCTSTCGDSEKAADEACDDGDLDPDNGCTDNCTVGFGYTCEGETTSICGSTCGDGLVAFDEICDDSIDDGLGGCESGCLTVSHGFECEGDEPSVCASDCGDGLWANDEICDDGNEEGEDGCALDCSAIAFGFICNTEGQLCASECGDGQKAFDEVCDDNDTADNNGCSADCMNIELHWTCNENDAGVSECNDSCGDGVRENFEECDHGENNLGSYGSCGTRCLWGEYCGDGKINGAEICDDGNSVAGDGCAADCLEVETGFICENLSDPSVLNEAESPLSLALSGRFIYWGTSDGYLWRKDIRNGDKTSASLETLENDITGGPIIADDEALFFTTYSANNGLNLYRLPHNDLDLTKAHLLYTSANPTNDGPAIQLQQSASHLYVTQMGFNETSSRIFQVGKHYGGNNDCLLFSEVMAEAPSCSAVTTKINGIFYGTQIAVDLNADLYFTQEIENGSDPTTKRIIRLPKDSFDADLSACENENACSVFFETNEEIKSIAMDNQHLYWALGTQGIQRKALDGNDDAESLLVSQAPTNIYQVFALKNNLMWSGYQNLQRGMKSSALHSQSNDHMTGLGLLDLQTQGRELFFIQTLAMDAPQLLQSTMAASLCRQRLSLMGANAANSQLNDGIILPNGHRVFAGHGQNALGMTTDGQDGFVVKKDFESAEQRVLRLFSKTDNNTATAETFLQVENHPSNAGLLALAHLCEDLNTDENCSAQLNLNQEEEAFFVGEGTDAGKMGLILSLNADLSVRWGRELLPDTDSTVHLVGAALASDGSTYVAFTHIGDAILTSNPAQLGSYPNQTISGSSEPQSGLAAYDPQGNLKWTKSLSASGPLIINDLNLIENSNSGHRLIAVGQYNGTSSTELGSRAALANTDDCLLLRVRDESTSGNLLSYRFIAGTEACHISSVHVNDEDRVAVAGSAQSNLSFYNGTTNESDWSYDNDNNKKDAFVFLLDESFFVYWNQTLTSGRTDDAFATLRFTQDNQLLTVVHIEDGGTYAARLAHLDDTGNTLWQRDLGGSSDASYFKLKSLDWHTHKQILITGQSAQNTLAQLPINISVGNPTADQTISMPAQTSPGILKGFALDLSHEPSGYNCVNGENCVSTCGDGIRAPDEACEDNNTENGDGCNSNCNVELGYSCSGDGLSDCVYDCSGLDAGDCELQEECDPQTEDCPEVLCDGGPCPQACLPNMVGNTLICAFQLGACTDGFKTCQANGFWSDCVQDIGPSEEVCDGEDNNCDGQTDEGFEVLSCGIGGCYREVYPCDQDPESDTFGQPVACTPGEPVEEMCNNYDDDCDDEIDEDLGDIVCGNGQCAITVPACTNGLPNQCMPNTNIGTEICDDVDNDCDGQNNEGLGALACGWGACTRAYYACSTQTFAPGELYDSYWETYNEETETIFDNVTCRYSTNAQQNFSRANSYGDPYSCGYVLDGDTWQMLCPTSSRFIEVYDAAQAYIASTAPNYNHPLQIWWFDADHPEWGYWWSDTNSPTIQTVSNLGAIQNQCPLSLGEEYWGETCLDEEDQYDWSNADPTNEFCDGWDNNCNGQVDENLGTLSCGQNNCATTVAACIDGIPQECIPKTPQPESCNDDDDDCDGEIDNGILCPTFSNCDTECSIDNLQGENRAPEWYSINTGKPLLQTRPEHDPTEQPCYDPNALEPGAPEIELDPTSNELWFLVGDAPEGYPVQLLAPIQETDGLIQIFEFDWGDGEITNVYSNCIKGSYHAWTHYYEETGSYFVQGKTVDNDGAVAHWHSGLEIHNNGYAEARTQVYYSIDDQPCAPLHGALFCNNNDQESPCPLTGETLKLRLYAHPIEGAGGPIGGPPYYGYWFVDEFDNQILPDSTGQTTSCDLPGNTTVESLLYELSPQSQTIKAAYEGEDTENGHHLPIPATFEVGTNQPHTITIDGERIQNYLAGEIFQLTATITDPENEIEMIRWDINNRSKLHYGETYTSYIPVAGTYTATATAWDKWGRPAYDQITIEISQLPEGLTITSDISEPNWNNSSSATMNQLWLTIPDPLCEITEAEFFINFRRDPENDTEKDLGGRIIIKPDENNFWRPELVLDNADLPYIPAINLSGGSATVPGTNVSSYDRWTIGQYVGSDPFGSQHIKAIDMDYDSTCDAFSGTRTIYLNFRHTPSYARIKKQQDNNDIAMRFGKGDGTSLWSTEHNPQGWLNYDANYTVSDNTPKLTIAGGDLSSVPGALSLSISITDDFASMHELLGARNDPGENLFGVPNLISAVETYFLDENFERIYGHGSGWPESNPDYYLWNDRSRKVFETSGIYYAAAYVQYAEGPSPAVSDLVQIIVEADYDEDGILDHLDDDDDNDGVCDKEVEVENVCTMGPDAFPKERSQWADSDGDGVGDNPDGCDLYSDEEEMPAGCMQDFFPNDPTEWMDSDMDGIGDNSDLDNDNDGLSDLEEISIWETNPYQRDTDGDTLNDLEEVLLWTSIFGEGNNIPDSDGDGTANHLDKDSDNDGWIDGMEDDKVGDSDGDGLENIRDPDSDNDGLKDGYDLAPYFKSNTTTTNGSGGGSAGIALGNAGIGSGDTCDPNQGPLPEVCEMWRLGHPYQFNIIEAEVVSGKMEGQTEIKDYDCCACFCSCSEDGSVRGPSCQDTVRSSLLNDSMSDSTLQQFNWQMEKINYTCDTITEESDDILPFYSGYTYKSPSDNNVGCLHDTQYIFDYSYLFQKYGAGCYNNLGASVLDDTENEDPYFFNISPIAVVPGHDNEIHFQLAFSDTVSIYQNGMNNYRIPGFKYRFYHIPDNPTGPVTDLSSAILVHGGDAPGALDVAASGQIANKNIVQVTVPLPKEIHQERAPGQSQLYLYISPMWEESGLEDNTISALHPGQTALEILGREEVVKTAAFVLITQRADHQDPNDLFEWGDVSDALMHLDNVGDNGPMDDILDWYSGTEIISRHEQNGVFKIGVFNSFNSSSNSFGNHVNVDDNNLDAILIIADSMRTAGILVNDHVICSDDDNCAWYEYHIPETDISGTGVARSYNQGTFLNTSVTLSDVTGENVGFGDSNITKLLDFIDGGVGFSQKVIKAIEVAPATQPGWHTDPKLIPNTKTLEIFNDSRVTIAYHRAGKVVNTTNKFQWELRAEFHDDMPWNQAEIDVDGQNRIRINTTKQIAKQRSIVEWDGTGDGPPPPDIKESKLVQDALENSDYPNKQLTQNRLAKMAKALAVGAAPFTIYFGYKEITSLSRDGSWDSVGSGIVALSTSTEMIAAGATLYSAFSIASPHVKTFDIFSPTNAKILGWISVGVDMGKGIGYMVKALAANTGATQARYGQRAAACFFDGAIGIGLMFANPVAGGMVALYSASTYAFMKVGYGNPVTHSLVGTPGAAVSTLFIYILNAGIPSAIIDDANNGVVEHFYSWQCALNNMGYETVIMLAPEETLSWGCTTNCSQDYTKENCYQEPEEFQEVDTPACND